MPGHHDAGNEYTSIEDAQTAALFAKEQGLGGKWNFSRHLKSDNWVFGLQRIVAPI